jgi:hypothetical protein
MSTDTDPRRYDPQQYDPRPYGPAYGGPEYPGMRPRQAPARMSRGKVVAMTLGAALAAAGITVGVIAGVAAYAPAAPAPAAPVATAPATGGSPAVTPSHGGHVTPPAPPVTPSAAIETLQRELGQLNYYEGPVTGVVNTQTTQAITYLQRDAGLPRTGRMDSATQAALARMLVSGNNHMGG